MCYAYGDKDKSRTSPDVRPTRGRKDSNGGSTSHPRTDTPQVILRWVHNTHLRMRDAVVASRYAGFLASLEHIHFACAPRHRSILSRQSREASTAWDKVE